MSRAARPRADAPAPAPPRPRPVVEPPLDGIGNFTGVYRCPVNGKPETVTFTRPEFLPSPEELPLDGLTVRTAAKLYNLTGAWPAWFRWIVGWPVPRVFLLEAARLALTDSQAAPTDGATRTRA